MKWPKIEPRSTHWHAYDKDAEVVWVRHDMDKVGN